VKAIPSTAEADMVEDGPTLMDRLKELGLDKAAGLSVSVGLHLVVLMALATIHFTVQGTSVTEFLSAMETVQEEQDFDVAMIDQVGVGSDVPSMTGGAPAMAAMAQKAPEAPAGNNLEQEMDLPTVSSGEDSDVPAGEDSTMEIQATGGAGTENVQGGTEGAIDRLTLEISQSLRTKKTLVVWMFDCSLSMRDRRNMIADRFENVYRQLDSLEATKDKALKTAVVSWGEKYQFITDKPVDDVRPLLGKVRSITPDGTTGKEHIFAAVQATLKQFPKQKNEGRNCMMIIVTDERGDDYGSSGENLDQAILQARRQGYKIYTVGNASLFGREKSYVNWKYDDGTIEELPTDGGPETVAPEALALGFWGGRGADLSRMSSGYGPYALTRLCKETGGLYFIVEEGAGRKFEPAVMRDYQPEYLSIKDYMLKLGKNKAKQALVAAAQKSKVDDINLPNLVFPAYNDNVLREALTEVQRPAAVIDFKMNELHQILAQGEKDRDRVSERRWQAAYDLAMGRVLAMRARIYGFNRMAAEMKGTPKSFTKKESNEWRLEPSKNSNATPDVKKIEKQALVYLNRVIDQHPGTPWAELASKEKDTPLGWEWVEAKGNYDIPDPNETTEQKRVRLAKKEEERKKMMQNAPPPRPKPNL
jgi:Mg-chelatase subunit ChlD